MSIKEKAKAYDELKVKAQELTEDGYIDKLALLDLFPELKEESEDERIRKYILSHLQGHLDAAREFTSKGISSPFSAEEIKMLETSVAWLEKQGEQKSEQKFFINDKVVHKATGKIWTIHHYLKDTNSYYVEDNDGLLHHYRESELKLVEQKSADKVEPKFKVGDWVMLDRPVLITKVEDMPYNTHQYWTSDGTWFGDATNAKLWDISDAKDGDVLATFDYILVFKERLKNDGGISYCHYDFGAGNPQFIWCEDKNWYFGKGAIVHPATKEQRDLLFQKMKEAGYEWNAEKKELKKIEQKSAENEELTEFDKAVGVSIGTWNPKTSEQIQSVKAVSKKLLKLAKKQINDEQKPAWSEEDEEMFDAIIADIQFTQKAHTHEVNQVVYEREIDWIKSLKDRVQPKQDK